MTAPITAETPAVAKIASRSKLERAIKRLYTSKGITLPVTTRAEIDPGTKTDISGLTTFEALYSAYLGTFPTGVDPVNHVGVRDFIWFAKCKGTCPAGEEARYNKVKAVVDSQKAESAVKRAAREANGPSQYSIDKRDLVVAALRKVKANDGQIEAALKEAGLPSLKATVAPKAAKSA